MNEQKFKILITRNIPGNTRQILERKCKLEIYSKDEPIPEKILKNSIRDKDGLICLPTDKIDKETMALGRNLKVISNYAVG